MKIYMASMFSRREELEALSPLLHSVGHECTARWVFGGEDGLSLEDIAILDLEDVKKADAVLSFTHPRGTLTPGGGRHVEFGYGLALGKRMILIGPRENVFHSYPFVEQYDHLMEFIAHEKDLLDRVTSEQTDSDNRGNNPEGYGV